MPSQPISDNPGSAGSHVLRLDISPEETALQLTENIPVGTYVMQVAPDGSPRFTFISERWLEMLNLERSVVLADPFNAFRTVHPDDYDEFIALNMEVFEKTLPFYWEGRCIVDGKIKWLIAESVPRRLPGGGTVWEGVMTDITERKHVEERLRASERSMRKILDHSPIPMGCNTLEERPALIYLNQQFTNTFGYTLADIPTMEDWARLAYPDEKYRSETFEWWGAAVAKALNSQGGGQVESKEFQVRCKDGTKRDTLISATILDDMVVASFLDITEQKQAEAALRLAQQEILKREIEKTQAAERERLLQDMHDGFGSQLASARLRVQNTRLSQVEIAKLLDECLTDLHLVVDVFGQTETSLQNALIDYRWRIEKRLDGQPVELVWQLALDDSPELPPEVVLQGLRIVQESIQNALKHANASQISIRAICKPDGPIILMVEDNGIGLPVNYAAGRGVKNMKKRADQIGGSIEFADIPDSGARVTFRLPVNAPQLADKPETQ